MKAGTLVTLSDECELITKGTTPSTLGFEVRNGGIPFVRAQNLVDGAISVAADPLFIDTATHNALKRSQIQPRDVLLSIAGTIGRAAIAPDDVVAMNCNQAVAIIRPSQRIDRRFLLHWFGSSDAQSQVARGKVTATISNLSLGQIGALRVPLPPLDEQRRIAAILDKADALRRMRKRSLELLDTLTQSIFLEMFGQAPAEELALRDVVRSGTIVTYGIVQAGPEFSAGVPYIRTGDLVDGEIQVGQLRRTDPTIADKFLRSRVEAGDIVMSIRATVGTTAMVPEAIHGANLTQGTARIAPGRLVLGSYLLAYLRSDDVQRWIAAQVKGATFREITLARLRDLPVRVPSIALQKKFEQRVGTLKQVSRLAMTQTNIVDHLFSALQHRAFSGQL